MERAKEITFILKHEYEFKIGMETSSVKTIVDIKMNNLKEWFNSDFM